MSCSNFLDSSEILDPIKFSICEQTIDSDCVAIRRIEKHKVSFLLELEMRMRSMYGVLQVDACLMIPTVALIMIDLLHICDNTEIKTCAILLFVDVCNLGRAFLFGVLLLVALKSGTISDISMPVLSNHRLWNCLKSA